MPYAMNDDRLLYQSSIIRGSYFNRMLDCGPYDRWVEIALGYLPHEILEEHKESLAFIANEGQSEVRYFFYVVLHEVAHAIKKHRSPQYDSLTDEEFEAQEKEADDLAFRWFNDHITALANPYLPAITDEEIKLPQTKSQEVMQRLLK